MRAKTTPPSLLILYYFTLKYEKEQYKIENMPKIYEHIYRNTHIQHYVYYNTVACVLNEISNICLSCKDSKETHK